MPICADVIVFYLLDYVRRGSGNGSFHVLSFDLRGSNLQSYFVIIVYVEGETFSCMNHE